MASQVMRITLKAYDHQLVDASAGKIIETVKKNGATVSGPVPLPTKKEVVTILRAVHKYKDSREQFEQRTAGRCLHRYQNETEIKKVLFKVKRDYPYKVDIEAML